MRTKIERATGFIGGLSQVLACTREELQALGTHGRVRYNVDFAYLYPVLLPTWTADPDDGQSTAAEQLLAIRDDSPEWLHLYLSRQSFLEFLDFLAHMMDRHGWTRDTIAAALPGFADAALLSGQTIGSAEILGALRKLTDKPLPPECMAPVERLVSLLESGRIEGLQDALPTPFEDYRRDFESLLHEMTQYRRMATRDPRPPKEMQFHYSVDVANILLTLRAAEGEPFFFLTPSAMLFQRLQSSGPSPRTLLSALLTRNTVSLVERPGWSQSNMMNGLLAAVADMANTSGTRIDVTMYYTTFISYGGPDQTFANKLHDALEDSGVDCWFFPTDSIPGKKLHRTMYEGVNDREKVVLVCSQASLNRPGVLNEIQETLQREAREGGIEILVPITLDDFVFTDWAPTYRNEAQAVRDRVIADFRGCDGDDAAFQSAIERLLEGLKR